MSTRRAVVPCVGREPAGARVTQATAFRRKRNPGNRPVKIPRLVKAAKGLALPRRGEAQIYSLPVVYSIALWLAL